MADASETTPFLDGTESPRGIERHPHFEFAIETLTQAISIQSTVYFLLFAAIYAFVKTGGFNPEYTSAMEELTGHMALCMLGNLIYTAATLFFQIPTMPNISLNVAMFTLIFILCDKTYNRDRSDPGLCLPATDERIECEGPWGIVMVMVDFGAIMVLFMGLLLVVLLLLKLAMVIAGTTYWRGRRGRSTMNRKPVGPPPAYQSTMNGKPVGPPPAYQ